MLRAAIVTIQSDNYGNRLQNYAVQNLMSNVEVETLTFVFVPPTRKKRLIQIAKKVFIFLSVLVYDKTKLNIKKLNHWRHSVYFEKSDRKNIKRKKVFFDETVMQYSLAKQFDFFICGSDQIWNPMFKFNTDKEFLSFVPQDKRVALAASFGVNELPEYVWKHYGELLKGFKFISVREQRGKEIIKRLADVDAEVILDPTLALERGEWLRFANEPKQTVNGPFLLSYFLGRAPLNTVESLAKKYGLKIININDFNNKEYSAYTPEEFVFLISRCTLVCTDSFHASVFSIIFHKPFVVFERDDNESNMNTRLETLLSTFGLEKRRAEYILKHPQNILETEYDSVDKILKEERQKFNGFVSGAVNYYKNK